MRDTKVNLKFTRTTADFCRNQKPNTDVYQEKNAKVRGLVMKKQEDTARWFKSPAVDVLYRDPAVRSLFKGGCRATALTLFSRGVVDLSRLYSTAEIKRQQAADCLSKKPSLLVRMTLALLTMDPEVIIISKSSI